MCVFVRVRISPSTYGFRVLLVIEYINICAYAVLYALDW